VPSRLSRICIRRSPGAKGWSGFAHDPASSLCASERVSCARRRQLFAIIPNLDLGAGVAINKKDTHGRAFAMVKHH